MKEKYVPAPAEEKNAEEMMGEAREKSSADREFALAQIEGVDPPLYSRGADVVKIARDNGIGEEKIRSYGLKVIDWLIRDDDEETARRFAGNMKIADDSEIDDMKIKIYRELFAKNPSNLFLAASLYGKDSDEYGRAEKLARAAEGGKKKKAAKRWEMVAGPEKKTVFFARNANMEDLFASLESADDTDEEPWEDIFWSEIYDQFGAEVAEEIEMARQERATAGKTKIIDFFRGRGYEIDDIEKYLPVKFR